MKKLLKVFLFLVIIFILALGGVIYYLNTNLPVGMIRTAIIENSEKQLGRKVDVGSISGTLFKGIEINDFSIKSQSGDKEFAEIKKIYLDYEVWPLLQKKIVIKRIRIEEPSIKLEIISGIFNFWDIFQKFSNSEKISGSKKKSFDVKIEIVKIVDGKLSFQNADSKIIMINSLQAEFHPNDMNNITGNLKCELDGKTNVSGDFSAIVDKGNLESNIKLKNFHIDDYWKSISPFVPAGLKITGDVISSEILFSLKNSKTETLDGSVKISKMSITHPAYPDSFHIKNASLTKVKKELSIEELDCSHAGINFKATGKEYIKINIDPTYLNKFSGKMSFTLDGETSVFGDFSTVLNSGTLESNLKVGKFSVGKYWSRIKKYAPEGMKISGDRIDIDGKLSLKSWLPVKYNADVSVQNMSIFHPKAIDPFVIKESVLRINEKTVNVDKLLFSHSKIDMNASGSITDFMTDAPYLELTGSIPLINIPELKDKYLRYKLSKYGDFPAVKALTFKTPSTLKDIKVTFKGDLRGKMKNWKYFAEADVKTAGLEYKKDILYKVPAFSCMVKLLENKLLIDTISMDGLNDPGKVTVVPSEKKVIVTGELNGTANIGKLYRYVKNNGIKHEKITNLSGNIKFNKMVFDVTIADKVNWDFNNGFSLNQMVLKISGLPDIVIPKGNVSGNKKKIVLTDCNVMGLEVGGIISDLKDLELNLKGKKTIAEILKITSQPMPKFKPSGNIDADISLNIDLLKGELTDFSGSVDGNLSMIPVNNGKMDAKISIKGNKSKIEIKKCTVNYLDVLSGTITGHVSNLEKLDLDLDVKLNKIEKIFDDLKQDAFRIYGDGKLVLKVKGGFKDPQVNGEINLSKGKFLIKGSPTAKDPDPKPFTIPFESINSPVTVISNQGSYDVKIVDGKLSFQNADSKMIMINSLYAEFQPNDMNNITGNLKFELDGKTNVSGDFSAIVDKGNLESNIKLKNLHIADYWKSISPFVPAGLKITGDVINSEILFSLKNWKTESLDGAVKISKVSIAHPSYPDSFHIKNASLTKVKKELSIKELDFSHAGINFKATGKEYIKINIDPTDLNKFSGKMNFTLDGETSVSGDFSTVMNSGTLESNLKVRKFSVGKHWSRIKKYAPEGMKISGDSIDIDGKISLKSWLPVKYNADVSLQNMSIFHPKAIDPFVIKESVLIINEKTVKVDKLLFSHSKIDMNASGSIIDFMTDAPYLELTGSIPLINIPELKDKYLRYKLSKYGDFPAVKALTLKAPSTLKDIKVTFKGDLKGKMKDWKYYVEADVKTAGLEYKKDMLYKVPAFSCLVKLLENKLIIKTISMDGLNDPGEVTVAPSGKKVIVTGKLNGTANIGKLYGYVKNSGIKPEKINDLSGNIKFNNLVFDVIIADKVSWDFQNGFSLNQLVLKIEGVPDIVIPKGKLSGNKKKIVLSDCNIMGLEAGGIISDLKNLELNLKGKKTVAEILKITSGPMPKFKPSGNIDADISLNIDLLKGELKEFSGSVEGKLSLIPANKGKMYADISIKGNKSRIDIKKCTVNYLDVISGTITGHVSNLEKLDLALDVKLNKIEKIFDELKQDAFRIYGDGKLVFKVKGSFKDPQVNGEINLSKGKFFIKGSPTAKDPDPKPFIIPFDSISSPVSLISKKIVVKPIDIILCDGQISSEFDLDYNKWPFRYHFGLKTLKQVKVEKVLFENKKLQNVLNGSMAINGKFSGNTDSVKALYGSGNAVVTKGSIQFPKTVSKFIDKIPGLEKLVYNKIMCDLNINNGVMYLGKCKKFAEAKMYANGRLFSFDGHGDLDFSNSFLKINGILNIMPELLKNSAYDVDKLIKNGLDQLAGLAKLIKIDLSGVITKLKNKFETEGIPVSVAINGKVPDELSYGMDTDSVSKYATDLIMEEGKKLIDAEKKNLMGNLQNGLLDKLLGGAQKPSTPAYVPPPVTAPVTPKTAPVPPPTPQNLEDKLKNILNNKLKDTPESPGENDGKIDGKDLLRNLFKF